MRGIRRTSVAATVVMALLVPIAALAILVRHDRPEVRYRELGERYARSLAWVRARDAAGIVVAEATLIAPRFALTAAHVGTSLGPGDSLVVVGRPHVVRRVVTHPGWDPGSWTHDVAVVELETCAEGGEPLPLYRWDDEEGRTLVVVGRGMTGTGRTGPVEDDGALRGATNRVDAVLGEWLRFTFDAPGSAGATDLEGISGPGDSGGPAILERDGTAWLAGVSSAQDDSATGGRPGRYGVHEYYARVSAYRSWIEEVVGAAGRTCAPGAAEGDPAAVGRPGDTALVGATVLAMNGSAPLPDAVVLIRGDRIAAVGSGGSIDVGAARTVDAAGGYLIPGLWDMHVHALFDASVLEPLADLFLDHGVTGFRDMGGPLDVLLEARRRIASGDLVAPRIVASGPVLDGPEPVDPSISWAVGTAEEARAAVDSLAAAGVDFVKVYTMLPREAFFAVVEAAEARGLPVAGHVPGGVDPIEAADAGMASVEHLRSEIEPFCGSDDPATCEALFAAFLEHGTWQTPTLVVRRNRAFLDDSTAVHGPAYGRAPAVLRELWASIRAKRMERGPAYFAEARAHHERERWVTGALDRAGVPILAGSDAGALFTVHGASLHEELALLVEAGLDPAEALAAATVDAARLLGTADSLGTIEPGKKADLVLLDGDPLADIGNSRRIRGVWLDGRRVGPGRGPAVDGPARDR